MVLKEKTWTKTEEKQGEKRKQIGILGGNFNPVHNGHLLIADQVKQQLGLEKVYLMPEYHPPHVDEKETISPAHRLEMLNLAISGNEHLGIETIELHRGGKSFTYHTMKKLVELNPFNDYYFIIGGDMVAYLPKWYKIEQLAQLVQFVGVERPDYKKESAYPIIWVDVPKMSLSSSMVRQMIARDILPTYLTPSSVISYILSKGLYKDEL